MLILPRSLQWYKRAADLGDRRAAQRLRGAPLRPADGPGSVVTRDVDGDGGAAVKSGKDKDCVVM